MFCELINAEYFMKTLEITSVFVSRMTAATKLLKMCLLNIVIDDEIFKHLKTIQVAILFVKHISSNGDVINGDVIKTHC